VCSRTFPQGARPCRATRTGLRIRMYARNVEFAPQLTPSRVGWDGEDDRLRNLALAGNPASSDRSRSCRRSKRAPAEARLSDMLFDHKVPAWPVDDRIV
jgi:hypothetical protein